MDESLESIAFDELADVTGGRITHGPVQISQDVIQMIGKLAESVQAAGQSIAQSSQANQQGMMQMMQQMMQSGGPPRR
jgi:hypothetical protein